MAMFRYTGVDTRIVTISRDFEADDIEEAREIIAQMVADGSIDNFAQVVDDERTELRNHIAPMDTLQDTSTWIRV